MYEKELIGFSKSGARYLIIGAVALGLSGHPRATFDLDIIPDLSSKNLEKIINTLTDLGYKPRLPVSLEDLKDPKIREKWYKEKHMRVFSFIDLKDPKNVVDLMIYYPLDFNECFKRKQIVKIQNNDIYVISIDDLLKLKKMGKREKDMADVKILEELKKYKNNE